MHSLDELERVHMEIMSPYFTGGSCHKENFHRWLFEKEKFCENAFLCDLSRGLA
jgi:hypothetical protein